MTIPFRPAVRTNAKILLGIAGPSGSGKTYSALLAAKGLANGGKVFMVDTEAKRGLHYADLFDFLHGEFTAPFTSERYLEAIQSAHKAGAAVIIVDSMSHEHEGPGGILEQHDVELTRMAGTDYKKRDQMKFTAWIKPKAAHNRFVNTVLQIDAHMIFCFRAKDKLVMKKNAQGKNVPVSIGFQAICADRFEYEMTTTLILPPGAKGVPDLAASACKLQEQHKGIFSPNQPITEQMGHALATWAAGSANQSGAPDAQADAKPAQQQGSSPDNAKQAGTTAAAIAEFWAKDNLAIPVKGTLSAWIVRFLAAANTARDTADLDRLKVDNQAPRMRIKEEDEVLYADTEKELDAIEARLGKQP